MRLSGGGGSSVTGRPGNLDSKLRGLGSVKGDFGNQDSKLRDVTGVSVSM